MDSELKNQDLASSLLWVLKQKEVLKTRTNAEVVDECLQCEAADYLVVQEMMDRLDPGWQNRPTEEG